MEIKKIKSNKMQKIKDFCKSIDKYGNIYHFSQEKLDEPFKKIMEEIKEVKN